MLEIGDVILVKETEQQKEQKHLDDVLGLIKKKEKELCVKDFVVGDIAHKGDTVEFSLESKPTGSLRPDVLMKACLEGLPVHIVSFERIAQRA